MKRADKIKQINICLDDVDGYTLSFTLGNPSRFSGTIKLCASTEAFVDVGSGDRIVLAITRHGVELLYAKVKITLDAWNTFSYEGFEWHRDECWEEMMRWAQ